MVTCVLARRACILLALFLAFSTVGWSQTRLGTVFGTITDLSGAVVVDAGITLINISTGLKRNARGEFFLAGLPSGRCSVHVQKQGFQTEVREGIALRSGDAVAINLSLAVDTVPQEITVKADLTGIDDTSSTVGGYLDGRGLTQLPINGRDLFRGTLLEAGVVPTPSSAPSLLSNGKAAQISINGMRVLTTAGSGRQIQLDARFIF